MSKKKIAGYGSWKSPITPSMVASKSVRLGQIAIDGKDIYWIEQRPDEGGRNVVVKRAADGKIRDITPPPFNARSLAHEYGGGAFLVHDGAVYFSNFKDQRLYRTLPGTTPEAITPEKPLRFADGIIDLARNRIVTVREDHSTNAKEAVISIVGVSLDGNDGGEILISGNDFYSSPRVNDDASRLAWLTWNHPNMPWDGCELWTGEIQRDGQIASPQKIAGGVDESIFQPEWSPDGALYFVSDRSGWWNLYRWQNGDIQIAVERAAEFGQPQWVFGMATYGLANANQIICTFFENGQWCLGKIEPSNPELQIIETQYSWIDEIRVAGDFVVLRGGSPTLPSSIARVDLKTGDIEQLRYSTHIEMDSQFFSLPTAITFATSNGQTAHAYFYRPQNPHFTAPTNERPPLIVKSHGGPTSTTAITLDLRTQFWTSRGFAVLDVNYGGSTGYGREYRQRLNGQWGIVDVDDCVNAARHVIEAGMADPLRTVIMGGSAGGYTTLAALTFRNFFRAGASYFGISDLESMAKDTHKFESRYLDNLIGPYPQRRDLYRQRSPIHFTDQLDCPLILFQGLEDKVVPPNQAETMLEAVRKKGLPVAYVPFEGEQHGFRQAATIQRALEAELFFYSKIFGFELADDVPPLQIENLF
jgi:dipeptidyl aminopeptidase/acylaminoacyl peptidase